MNGPYYEEWFTNKFLPNIQPGSATVMDNALQHSIPSGKIPQAQRNKKKFNHSQREKTSI